MSTSKKYPAESYTKAECRALLDALPDRPVGVRNRALIVLLWRAGLRLAEALALRERDIDFENQSIRVLHGKGDKARTVGIDLPAIEVLRQWKVVRDTLPSGPFICTLDGGSIHQSYVRTMLPKLARKAGVQRRVHAHGFRHTFAVELARERVPMPLIQRLLGHSSLATTSIYIASLSPEEALDAVRSRQW